MAFVAQARCAKIVVAFATQAQWTKILN